MSRIKRIVNILSAPAILFCIGWAFVFLALLLPLPAFGDTFILSWKTDLVAAIFLLLALLYLFSARHDRIRPTPFTRDEAKFIILPLILFIVWSGLSAFWASWWLPALHHTLIWTIYLVFFLFIRELLERRNNLGRLLSSASISLTVIALFALVGYCTVLAVGTGPSLGIIYSKYSEQVNSLFPLLFVAVLLLPEKKFKLGVVILVLLWLMVFASLSRTGWGLFIFGSTITSVFLITSKRLKQYRTRLALVIVLLITSPFPLHIFSVFSDKAGLPMVERVSDSAGITGSNNFRILMLNISAEMFRSAPILGIGADNFGFKVNDFRIRFSERYPDDLTLAESEAYLPERAHNEFVQISAELGSVGILLFGWFLFGVALIVYRATVGRNRLYPLAFASAIGLVLFLASSLVTSYSFRLIQNGFVFFFLLAIASRYTMRSKRSSQEARFDLKQGRFRFAHLTAVSACVGLAVFCGVRAWSSHLTNRANAVATLDLAEPIYRQAMALDPTNPEARYSLGLRFVEVGRYAEAVPHLEESLKIGKGRSSDHSYLATAQSLAGDNVGAERTFEIAVKMYPRSPFVLTRYAALLRINGKFEESEKQLARARAIDTEATNSWWAFINNGAKAASELAHKRDDHLELMDLAPNDAIYAVLAERDIRFPDERIKFPWEKPFRR
ncbi:O-antigen ligase family protein [Leptolyngbya sp. 7M]|uniref:O-antigen ligase family protein n=1 Tax=Leptolyngbya sp. 7M TaxID=2812896 RepID=UPI001B8C0F14|nr:O-antigen ligase family protein [Leptolyngbya sp. 7M]QYO66205.1 O-antigen ligase family protein [Leptolyngbya sp. 7M]